MQTRYTARCSGLRLTATLIALMIAGVPQSGLAQQADAAKQPTAGVAANADAGPRMLGEQSEVIKVNLLGWRPGDTKVVIFTDPVKGANAGIDYTPGERFEVRRTSDQSVAFAGSPVKIVPRAWNDGDVDKQSGDRVWWGDFSTLTEPGEYYVYDPAAAKRSYTFRIDQSVYTPLLKHVLRFYLYQRQGTPLAEANCGVWRHSGAYMQDRHATDYFNPGQNPKDVSGGWSDAGDPTKYVSFTPHTIWQMLTAYELNKAKFDDALNIPESGNGVPDILDEVKWELDFILRMQDADGGVHNRVTHRKAGGENFLDPSTDKAERFYTAKTTWSTSTAVVGLANASRFAEYDVAYPRYRDTLRAAAEKGWQWLQQHPEMHPADGSDCGGKNISYGADGGSKPSADLAYRIWAAGELYRATGNPQYKQYVVANAGEINWDNEGSPGQQFAWLAVLSSSGADPAKLAEFKSKLVAYCTWRNCLDQAKTDPYHIGPYRTLNGGYWWGYNQTICGNGWSNVLAINLGADPSKNDYFTQNALQNLDYILGRNPMNQCYITNLGAKGAKLGVARSVMEPFHSWWGDCTSYAVKDGPPWPYDGGETKTMYGPPPGVLVGGPNAWTDWGKTSPAAKCYIDANGTGPTGNSIEGPWLYNECGIYYQAQLLYLMTYFSEDIASPAKRREKTKTVQSSRPWTPTQASPAASFGAQCTPCAILCKTKAGPAASPGKGSGLRVSDNHRFLVTAEGKPFFWLADTAWQMIHDLDEAEMRRYFADRRDKGFTVIQTVALTELRSDKPNAYGHFPIEPKRPDEPIVKDGPDNDYWDDVERALRLAKEHDLHIALLPTWGKWVISDWQNGLVNGFFNVNNAEAYGRFIGSRFKGHDNVIWILGGDKAAPTDAAKAVWRAMARGIAVGVSGAEDYSKTLMTYHTSGPGSTAWFLNDEPWLDFHALQSGHGRWAMNWLMVEHAYTMKPTLPVIDLETSYPDFRHGRPPTIATDDDARRAAYWAVFAGAAGHTYGHHSIWQMHSPKYPGVAGPKEFWYDALNAPSARQMGYLRKFIESHSFFTQKPDLSLIAFEQTLPWEMCLALRGDAFAMIYTPTGRELDVNLDKLPGGKFKAKWFDPRTGESTALGEYENQGRRTFDPPGEAAPGNDWVLVMETVTE